MKSKEQLIIDDIRNAAAKLKIKGGEIFSRTNYFSVGNYNSYHIYDGGRTWEYYCTKAGFSVSKVNSPVADEFYFKKLKDFVEANHPYRPKLIAKTGKEQILMDFLMLHMMRTEH